MEINFYKYQGTGNDFIILDNRDGKYNSLTDKEVNRMCNRHFGIGADGLMMLNQKPGYDFEMIYYNSDGRRGSMCGNGGRCIVKFASDQGILKSDYLFFAVDGDHEAAINDEGLVRLKMKDVNEIENYKGDLLINTGSPHYIRFADEVLNIDVYSEGVAIRTSDDFVSEGINVNFVEQQDDDTILVRTFERGVEDETLSCGTGVTAAAIASYHNENGFNDVTVNTRGGKLHVEYMRVSDEEYREIWLIGPAEKVFEGKWHTDGK